MKMQKSTNKRKPTETTARDLEFAMTTPKIPTEIKQCIGQRPFIKYKNKSQYEYAKKIKDNEITICTGPPGTGKSMIAISTALDLLWQDNNEYEKIIIIKPNVEVGEKLGYLPGDMNDKISVYVYSSLYLVEKILGKIATKKLSEENLIDCQALAYLRGVNIDNAILIFEEAQNCLPMDVKTVLTRIGENSKMLVTGDLFQSDKCRDYRECGLYDAMTRLEGVPGIAMHTFDIEHIVRNPLIGEILKRYEDPHYVGQKDN